jgi:hypothetical protein
MQNPFSLSDEKLVALLNGLSDWYAGNEQVKKYAEEQREKAIDLQNTLLNAGYLSTLSDDELAGKIFEYSRTLEGPAYIRLGKPRISEKLPNVKRNLLYLSESSDDPFKKAAKILEGDYKIPIFAKAFWTPIFQAQYPDKLPNWNNKTERFLKKAGINLSTSKLTIEDKYKLLSDAFSYLRNLDPKQDLHSLNHLMHYGTEIKEGMELMEQLVTADDFVKLTRRQEFDLWVQKYIKARKLGNKATWNEEYKWAILPVVHEQAFGSAITAENVVERIDAFRKNNPPRGSFVHWNNLSDVKEIAEQEPIRFVKILNQLFQETETLSKRIDGVISACRKIKSGAKLGTPLFGYLLGAYNYEKYPLYKGTVFDKLRDLIDLDNQWRSFSIGMKYQKFQQLCLAMGKYLDETGRLEDLTSRDVPVRAGITALDGQDFFYFLTHYLDRQPPDPEPDEGDKALSRQEILYEIFMDEQTFDQIVDLIHNTGKKQVILQGPPGTGKTFISGRIARYLATSARRIETLQFHPSFSYEDFIEGYRPSDEGAFELRGEIFKTFCEKARGNPEENHVLIIDEINRGNLSKIFGELLYLLEYRDQEVKLTHSSESFSIPENLCIIGTMNTADRSLAIMDYALRRRFYFVGLKCETKRLGEWLKHNKCQLDIEDLMERIEKVNEEIESEMRSMDFAIGLSYFMRKGLDAARLRQIIAFEIKPLLEEYFFDKRETVEQILTDLEEYAG